MSLVKDIPHSFDFGEERRAAMTLSDDTKVRLDPEDLSLKLLADSDGVFPTDDDLNIITYEINPRSAKVWTGFQALDTLPDNTLLQYRLHDGTDERYWGGSSWDVAGTSDWNTEAEIYANIGTFPVSKLRIVVNLKSTDGVSTPEVQSILVGYQAEICFLDDWVYRTLVPYFEDNIRPWARWTLEKGTTGTTVDLNSFPLDSNFNIQDVVRVYNETDDPGYSTDILSSYDTGTKIITLTVSVDAGKILWIEFVYALPVIVTTTSTDFTQVRSVPCIVLENIRIVDRQRFWVNNSVVDKATGDLVIYPPSWTIKLALDVVMLAPTSVDGMRLTETVQAYLENNRIISADGTDIPYDINVIDPWVRTDMTEFSNLETSRMSIEVCNLQAWLRTAITGEKAVQSFKITGDNISVVI